MLFNNIYKRLKDVNNSNEIRTIQFLIIYLHLHNTGRK